jgi:hypothetical protein
MKEYVFEQKMSEDRARQIAAKKGDWVWGVIFNRLPLTEVRLMYLEFLLINVRSEYMPGPLEKLRNTVRKNTVQELEVLADGTNGRIAMVADRPKILIKELEDDNNYVQRSDFDDNDLLSSAKKVAVKVAHRFMGGIPLVEVTEYRSVFRPYWVAFYGDMREGNKVRYLPIAADGGSNKRVR